MPARISRGCARPARRRSASATTAAAEKARSSCRCVTLDPANLRILVEYVDGPFRYLENRWTFKPHESGCEIGFFISYEFASRMLGLLMGAMFDKAFRKFAEAFERRADLVYGGDAKRDTVTAS
ncbi:MAG: hypothetical protein B7Z40_17240 [Bosea sp. 12-68-7]|nr:MAG: hypothetical protein B7Z40_17240 [Bosea sp. 12-68-7]